MLIDIDPITFSYQQTVSKVFIQVTSFRLFEGVTIRVTYHKENGEIISFHNFPSEIELTPEQYQQWGADDQYIINQILNQVGFSAAPVFPPSTPIDLGEGGEGGGD